MGQIDAISASDRARAMVPVRERSIPHTSDEGPPLRSEVEKLLAIPSHDASNVTDKARIESESNFRCELSFPVSRQYRRHCASRCDTYVELFAPTGSCRMYVGLAHVGFLVGMVGPA